MQLEKQYSKSPVLIGKRRLRSTAVLIASFLFAVGTLSSCGSGPSDSSSQTADPPAPPAGTSSEGMPSSGYTGSSPVVQEQKTISVLTTNGASHVYDFDNMAWWQEILKRANIKVDLEMVDAASYGDVIKPRLAAAVDLPDVVQVGSSDSDMAYINSGLFLDLTDLYKTHGFNLNAQFEENPILKAELTTPDGRIFYIPYLYLTADWCRSIMVNTPWLEALQMEQPTDMDAFYELLKAIKETDLNQNGKNDEVPLFMRANMTQLFGVFWGLDLVTGYRADDEGKVTCSYSQPAYKDFLSYFNKLYNEGLLYSEFSTANLDTQTALFHNNQIGVILHFMSNCTGYSNQIDPNWKFNVDEPIMQPILPPQGPNGDAYYYGRDGLGSFFAITKDCKDPATAFSFLDYLYSKEATKLSWYGFEGTDYTVASEELQFTDVYLKNENKYRENNGYNFAGLPSVQIAGSYGATQCRQIMEKNAIIREHTKNPIGFSFNLPEEVDTVQAYSADLNTYFSEMFVAFITGTTPLTQWDSYLSNLKSMHVDDMTAVYQAITDRQSAAAE